jgi:hypothetical protein
MLLPSSTFRKPAKAERCPTNSSSLHTRHKWPHFSHLLRGVGFHNPPPSQACHSEAGAEHGEEPVVQPAPPTEGAPFLASFAKGGIPRPLPPRDSDLQLRPREPPHALCHHSEPGTKLGEKPASEVAASQKNAREGHDFSRTVECFWVAQRFSAAMRVASMWASAPEGGCKCGSDTPVRRL